jgi:LemA protein
MDSTVIIVLVLCAVAAVALLLAYNGLARGRLAVREAWSGIDVQLQRRAELVPNLVETVRGYARHESETLDRVTQARVSLQGARTPAEATRANDELTRSLGSLIAVAEAYPDLKASANFRDLQSALAETENKLAYARNYYNALVLRYNGQIATVPSSFVAGAFGFEEAAFFQAEAGAQAPVRVDFSK